MRDKLGVTSSAEQRGLLQVIGRLQHRNFRLSQVLLNYDLGM